MKKVLSLAIVALLSNMVTYADKNLFSGSQSVTWESTLYLAADNFSDINIGDQIVVSVAEGATDVMELKSNGSWLSGSAFNWLDGKTEVKATITQEMMVSLGEYGLELCGPSFTVTSVDIISNFMSLPEGAIWGGYFWIDGGWNTLELYKTAFNDPNPSKIIINLTDEAVDSNFIFNVLTKWDDDYMKLSTETTMTVSGQQVVIDLTQLPEGRTLASYFENENTLKIQGHVESGNSFNITSVVLESNTPVSSFEVVEYMPSNFVDVYSLTGCMLRQHVAREEATLGLPAGLYIVGNRKIVVR